MYDFSNFVPFNLIGVMFHRKPLYVAVAQRKEERKAQLQLQHSQRMATGLSGPSSPLIPGGYSPFYYPASSVPHVPPRPGLMYQPIGMRPDWMAKSFAPPTRPAFQALPVPVSTLCKVPNWLINLIRPSIFLLVLLPHIKFLTCRCQMLQDQTGKTEAG